MSLTQTSWYLQTVYKCSLERLFQLAMYVSLYGIAPCSGGPIISYYCQHFIISYGDTGFVIRSLMFDETQRVITKADLHTVRRVSYPV